MPRPSSKSIEQSINGRKNILKRFDRASQAVQSIAVASGQDADLRGGQDAEELQVVEVRLRQSEIDNALKRLSFSPEADKRLKYTTRPGGSELSMQRVKAKFGMCQFADETLKRKNQEHERSRAAEEEILADRITDNANGANAMNSDECDESAGYIKLQQHSSLTI
ncbi:hypothetical protein V1523DRAFT_429270 [Lipomyces doorenjongii]